jgi:hypothetical protein
MAVRRIVCFYYGAYATLFNPVARKGKPSSAEESHRL